MPTTEYPHYLADEVVIHNEASDCWLSCLGRVYDLTEYVARNRESPVGQYLVAHAGKDVSHWFDAPPPRKVEQVARLRRYTDPESGERRILLPFSTPLPMSRVKSKFVPECSSSCCRCVNSLGDDVNCSPSDGAAAEQLTGNCWIELEQIFNGAEYQRGLLTKNARPCAVTNVLTGQRAIISVCEEDSIRRIQERASIWNRRGATSYTWKYEGKPLNLALSLTDNGIMDERDLYLGSAAMPTTYVPNLLCYYNDDLTE